MKCNARRVYGYWSTASQTSRDRSWSRTRLETVSWVISVAQPSHIDDAAAAAACLCIFLVQSSACFCPPDCLTARGPLPATCFDKLSQLITGRAATQTSSPSSQSLSLSSSWLIAGRTTTALQHSLRCSLSNALRCTSVCCACASDTDDRNSRPSSIPHCLQRRNAIAVHGVLSSRTYREQLLRKSHALPV